MQFLSPSANSKPWNLTPSDERRLQEKLTRIVGPIAAVYFSDAVESRGCPAHLIAEIKADLPEALHEAVDLAIGEFFITDAFIEHYAAHLALAIGPIARSICHERAYCRLLPTRDWLQLIEMALADLGVVKRLN